MLSILVSHPQRKHTSTVLDWDPEKQSLTQGFDADLLGGGRESSRNTNKEVREAG